MTVELCYFCNRIALDYIEIEEPVYDVIPVCKVHIDTLYEPDEFEDGLSYGEL